MQAIEPRNQVTLATPVEGLPATVNRDTAAILNLQAVAIRNHRTIPTTLNTTRVNTPSKPVPERPCPVSNNLTFSTFLTEQDEEGAPSKPPPTPGPISRYSSPRRLAVFLTVVLMFRLLVPHSVFGLLRLFEIDFSSSRYFLFHMPLEL
jgi:hypothetical protein